MSDPLEQIEAQLRAKGVKCFSIRPLAKGFKVNYRLDDAYWQEGTPGKTLRAAFVNTGLLSPATAAVANAPDDYEDLLG